MRTALLMVFVFVHVTMAYPQNDFVGSGRAIEFDGIDDYIDLGNIYDDLALPMTISAWVYVDPKSEIIQYPIFDSQDGSSAYNGFTFVCSTLPHIGYTIGDGKGGNNPAFRRSRAGYFETLGRWVHMTAVARSGYDITLYMNGHMVEGEYQGSSPYPMDSNFPGDVAKIGFLSSNGFAFWFKGIMDEVRIYKRALTDSEIRATMCKRLKGDEPGLIGYWNFDETAGDVLKDYSPNGFDGVLKGNPKRVFSGAPVGDESVFLYTNDWTGKTLSNNTLLVSNVSANAYGVHIYKVNHIPSQTGGLDVNQLQIPYDGVFLADDDVNNTFDLAFNESSECQYFQRKDNSVSSWNPSASLSTILSRIEIVRVAQDANETFQVNLGQDLKLCNQTSYVLNGHPEPSGKTFLWNTGQTSPSIAVTSNGEFWVEVREQCKLDRDTVHLDFLTAPPLFSLGADELSCDFTPRNLKADLESHDFSFAWQDGSTGSSLVADSFGTYWLQLENVCGVASDTITFTKKIFTNLETYNFISPNNQDDRNQFFVIDERLSGASLSVFNRWGKPVFESAGYENNWDGDDLPSGVYFYTVLDECIEPLKGTLTIMR